MCHGVGGVRDHAVGQFVVQLRELGPDLGLGLAGDLLAPPLAGAGAHGPREYDWARIPVRAGQKRGRGHWLLARRSISDPAEIAYYACYGPRRPGTADLAWIAGSRWHIDLAWLAASRAQAGKGGSAPATRE
jgi:hypothetical protein